MSESENYDRLSFNKSDLSSAMLNAYAELIAFVTSPEFRELYSEILALAPADRPRFVSEVVVNRDELGTRGIVVPEGILIQTSAFGDRRPTLFAVKKFLDRKFHAAWENVNLTFDNPYTDDEVPRDTAMAWRAPLPVSLQSRAIAQSVDLQRISDQHAVSIQDFAPTNPIGWVT